MKLAEEIKAANRVFICGNGGSAANSQHIANDLISVGIPAHALTADVSTMTAIGNDFGYEHIFERQINVFGNEGDLLIVLSGSGNSTNIIMAMIAAKAKGMKIWALVGGGYAQHLADEFILTGENMQDSEEAQIRIGHELMRAMK